MWDISQRLSLRRSEWEQSGIGLGYWSGETYGSVYGLRDVDEPVVVIVVQRSRRVVSAVLHEAIYVPS